MTPQVRLAAVGGSMANGDLVKLTWRHRENSYNTQRARRAIVRMMARQLGDMGFRQLKAKNLKEKHALALVERWRGEGLSAGTLKNRMGCCAGCTRR